MLAKELGEDKELFQKGPTGRRHELVRAITEAAADPDIDIAYQPKGNNPLGIDKENINRGVIPKGAATEAQRASAQYLEARTWTNIDRN